MRIAVEGIPAAGRLVDFTIHDAWALEAATRSLDAAPEALKGSMLLRVASKRAGLVRVEAAVRDGKVESVTFENVPAFAVHLDRVVEVLG